MKLTNLCQELKIQGKAFRKELVNLVEELPMIFGNMAELLCNDAMKEGILYHTAVQEYLWNAEIPTSKSSSRGKKTTKTTTSISDMITMTAIEALMQASSDVPEQTVHHVEETAGESGIVSWDVETPVADISWDITTESTTGITTELVTDITTESTSGTAIEWDITTEQPHHEIAWDITCESETIDSSKDKSTRVGLLSDNDFRIRIKNELMELQAFFEQRLSELTSSDAVIHANQFQGLDRTLLILVKMIL